MGGNGGGSGALDQERQQLEAQQQLLNEKKKKAEAKRIAALRAQFTSGGLQDPGTSATAPATLGGATTTTGTAPGAPFPPSG